MLDCATAAFMKRRSRMAEVMAAVPTAAQAARRMNSRRVMTEKSFCSILFLNGVVRRIGDEMNDGPHAVALLRGRRRRAEGEIHGVGDVIYNVCLGGGGQLAGEQQTPPRGHVARLREVSVHPRADVERDCAVAGSETGNSVGVVPVIQDA